jgi:2-phospho-L-lactate/phosphoenolpyruvate guanylyltransferase
VVIPVKTLALGKSRLSVALSPEHRVRLTEDVLRRLIHLLRGERRVDAIAVVSRDPQLRLWLRGRRVRLLRESGEGLNAALSEARAQLPGVAALLVLPSDLAALSAHDVAAMLDAAASPDGPCVVIAPDRHGAGTNALLVRPPGLIDFQFGPDSAARHAAAARAAGVEPVVYRSDSIALDLDSPEDYELYSGQW